MDKYRVTLTTEERAELEQLVSCGKAAARKLVHARVLLLTDDSCGDERPDDQIVAALGISPRTVSRVRRQLVTEGFDTALCRRRQPPRPDKIKIKGDIEQRLIELACSEPPKGRCHWTLQLLADELVVLGLVDRIGIETVRLALKKKQRPDTELGVRRFAIALLKLGQENWSLLLRSRFPHDLAAVQRLTLAGRFSGRAVR